MEIHNTIYEIFSPEELNLNLPRSLVLTTNLQKTQGKQEHVKWQYRDAISTTKLRDSLKTDDPVSSTDKLQREKQVKIDDGRGICRLKETWKIYEPMSIIITIIKQLGKLRPW